MDRREHDVDVREARYESLRRRAWRIHRLLREAYERNRHGRYERMKQAMLACIGLGRDPRYARVNRPFWVRMDEAWAYLVVPVGMCDDCSPMGWVLYTPWDLDEERVGEWGMLHAC